MKYKTKKWLKILGLVLVGAILGGAITAVSGISADNSFGRELNKENLIKVDETYIKSGTADKGIDWKVQENGTIKLFGKASSADSITIQTVDLEAGEYTYSVGNDKVNKDKYYSYVLVGGTECIAGTDSATFEIAEAVTVQVVITWFEDTDFGSVVGTTFRPVLVKGANAGSFWAK